MLIELSLARRVQETGNLTCPIFLKCPVYVVRFLRLATKTQEARTASIKSVPELHDAPPARTVSCPQATSRTCLREVPVMPFPDPGAGTSITVELVFCSSRILALFFAFSKCLSTSSTYTRGFVSPGRPVWVLICGPDTHHHDSVLIFHLACELFPSVPGIRIVLGNRRPWSTSPVRHRRFLQRYA